MFQLNPGPKLVSLLLFLESSGIDFVVTDRERFVEALTKEVNNPQLTPSLLYNLKIDVSEIPAFAGFREAIEKMESLPPGNFYRKPNAAFKHFCGSEALTVAGCITRDQALECVYRYVKTKALRNDEYGINLDQTLQEALGSGLGYIKDLALVALVESVF